MDIKKLTQDYKERFFAYAEQVAENPSKKGKKKGDLQSPNFLKEVIRPILDALVDQLPEYGFSKTTDKYEMYGEYYRIKAGIVLIGGLSIDDDFKLAFTPLFHGKPCGQGCEVVDLSQLVITLRREFERRGIKKSNYE